MYSSKLELELFKHKFIAFVVDHYNPLGVIRSLGEKGIKPIVILVSKAPVLIPKSKYIGVLHRVDSIQEGYELLIKLYSNEEYKPFVFCSDDNCESYLDCHYEYLKDSFIFYNACEQGRVTLLQNKEEIIKLAQQVGLSVPKSEVVETGVLPRTLRYPIITKVLASTMGAWKGDVYICYNEVELEEAYKKIKSDKLILQEYISKQGEFCMEGFSINDGNDIFIPYVADYIRYYNDSYGHYMNIIPFHEGELKEKIKALFKLTKYNGIFEIEFMKGPDGHQYFLEINMRASTWNYAITVGGGNLPYFWAKSTIAGRVLYEEMNLRDQPFKAMVEITDFFNNVIHGNVSVCQWIKEFRSSECTYTYNKKDNLPFYAQLGAILKAKLTNRRNT